MTQTKIDTNALVAELSALLRLTRAEAAIARIRVSQATRDEIRRELAENARKADQRANSLQAAIQRLGGAPDVFAAAFGTATAVAKAGFEQAQPFSEALLGDLALERQLLDRARFSKVIAEATNRGDVVALMKRLEIAHNATIEWITLRLAEVAQGGPAALRPTPTQVVVGAGTRLALVPARQSAAAVNRAFALVQKLRGKAAETVEQLEETVERNAAAATEVFVAGRDAALERAEEVAPYESVREGVHETREDLGTVAARDLPIKGYENLSGANVIRAINELDDADDVRVILAFEAAHKNRSGVLNAAEKRVTSIAREAVSV